MISIKNQALFEEIKALPKAEVHLHLDGAVPAEDIFSMARKTGTVLRKAEYDQAGNLIAYANEKERNLETPQALAEYWMDWSRYSIPDRFGIVTGMMQTREELKAISRFHVDYLKKNNIVYAETRFAPQYHMKKGLSLGQVIGHVLEGLSERSRETGVVVKLIVCIGREMDGEKSVEVARAALEFQDRGVVALDLACWETPYPPERHRKAFELTFDSSLKRTVHAGEMCPKEEQNLRNIHTAITELKANGLGHAIPLHKRYYRGVDLIEMIVERGIRLESNPISNLVVTSLRSVEDLHLDKLMAEGVAVTLNSDDPAMWPDGSLSHNLYVVAECHGLPFIFKALECSVQTAFGLTPEQKKRMVQTIGVGPKPQIYP